MKSRWIPNNPGRESVNCCFSSVFDFIIVQFACLSCSPPTENKNMHKFIVMSLVEQCWKTIHKCRTSGSDSEKSVEGDKTSNIKRGDFEKWETTSKSNFHHRVVEGVIRASSFVVSQFPRLFTAGMIVSIAWCLQYNYALIMMRFVCFAPVAWTRLSVHNKFTHSATNPDNFRLSRQRGI